MSTFEKLPVYPDDPILGLMQVFDQLKNPHKVNLGVGIYYTEEGRSKVFDAVRIAEKKVAGLPKDYAPILGDPGFLKEVSHFAIGEQKGFVHCQTVGGTSSLYSAGRLLKQAGIRHVAISDPSWPNHQTIFQGLGFDVHLYPNLEVLAELPVRSAVLLQASCHNPTGIDPTLEQFEVMFDLIAKKKHVIVWDNAYQGLKEGVEKDKQPILKSIERGLEQLVATSFSKNFGLYGERIGLLSVFCRGEEKKVSSTLAHIVRTVYSNPPLMGARLVYTVLHDPQLKEMWLEELEGMRKRLKGLRKSLQSLLNSRCSIEQGAGLFCMMDFTPAEVDRLREEKGIVMLSNGRINISGLNAHNLEYVADAFNWISNE